MKRIALILGIFLFLLTSPVFAKKDEDKAENRKNIVEVQVSVEDECPSDKVWKNHGQYVSCVAKYSSTGQPVVKQGGAVVSAAAKSDIGKKPEASPAPEASSSPSPSPSASASASPSPSSSPSASPTASPLGTTGGIESAAKLEISALIEILKNLIKSLEHLMSN